MPLLPIPNLIDLFSDYLPVRGMTRHTRTPIIFAPMEANARFFPIPGTSGIITANKNINPLDMSTVLKHEQAHVILNKTGVPKTTYSERLRPAIEAELESRGYDVHSRLANILGNDPTLDEGLAFAITDPLSINSISQRTRNKFIDEAFSELNRQGKDISILKKLRVP